MHTFYHIYLCHNLQIDQIVKTLPLCTRKGYAISLNGFELYLKTEVYK